MRLTFDACGGRGGSGVDTALIELLRSRRVPATLFLNARWIASNPAYALELLSDPTFLVQSHGHRHVPLSVTGRSAYGIPGTGSVGEVYDEVTGADPWFVEHAGAAPRFMRPGTAFCDDVALQAARFMGRSIVGFSVNGDGGATFPPATVSATLQTVRPGEVVISHLNHPGGGTYAGYREALPQLLDKGIRFATLD